MKTSHILFASTILMATLSAIFHTTIGNAKMTHENQPVNTLSAWWMNQYDLKVTHELPQSVKYLKVIGNNRASQTHLYIQKTEQPSLFSMSPQNFTHEIKNDTLFIYATDSYNSIYLRQQTPIEQITLREGNASIVGINQENLTVDVQRGSRLTLGNNWYNRKKTDTIAHLDLQASDRSNVNLHKLKIKTATVKLKNAVLNYDATVEADSFMVALTERSTVISQNRDVINQVNHLIVSGNEQYFQKKFAGKNVTVTIRP
ncbi:hypothetical protein [Sphingobacterium arenae]|uniref:Auto-transporter adhesin head GIN domain-containing protein n=1 Tax=Sphingobacterium arenae TaxID=1280598 RepID=A0ABR7Y7A9_9SPHI|nr:hypothetical protein [Sphingobacterium arenae]MBD1427179.1 hypothetical protein [Sphingobacterium arenae]